jgi:TetR/AcrR family transcriptional regulator
MIPVIVYPEEKQPARLRSLAHAAPPKRAARKKYDAAKTRANILSIATREFARNGYNGARIDAIAARTSTTKRMIYYYFGGKEQLYIAVLEEQ